VAVRIRMKMLGRKHRPYFRIVAIDSRQPRDGRILEELGSYDPWSKTPTSGFGSSRADQALVGGGGQAFGKGRGAVQEVHGEIRASGGPGGDPGCRCACLMCRCGTKWQATTKPPQPFNHAL